MKLQLLLFDVKKKVTNDSQDVMRLKCREPMVRKSGGEAKQKSINQSVSPTHQKEKLVPPRSGSLAVESMWLHDVHIYVSYDTHIIYNKRTASGVFGA